MIRFIAIFNFLALFVGYADDAVIVNLDNPDTLMAVFESGLHPRRAYRTGGHGYLEIRPAQAVGFQIKTMRVPPVKAVWRLLVASNDQLISMDGMVEESWTKAEAFEKARELESALGGDVAALKQWIDSYPSPSETGDLWGRRWRSEDGARSVKYYFRHTMQDARPLTISISIELNWPGRKRGFREMPIKPPVGYEHVDISFDESYGGTAPNPLPKQPNATVSLTGTRSPSGVRGMATELPNDSSRSSTKWSVIIVFIVAATGLLWFLVKKRK